jgi:hypothetical protein
MPHFIISNAKNPAFGRVFLSVRSIDSNYAATQPEVLNLGRRRRRKKASGRRIDMSVNVVNIPGQCNRAGR